MRSIMGGKTKKEKKKKEKRKGAPNAFLAG